MRSDVVISVITVCRNCEGNIAKTLRSVLGQSYPAIEYVIVDGKSTDSTMAVIGDIVKEYPHRNVKVVSEKDDGIADAMNKGVALSAGTLITHLHAGDYYSDNTSVEQVLESYERHKWRWGVAYSSVVDAEGQQHYVFKPETDFRALIGKNSIPHQSTFLMRDIFSLHGGFDSSLKQAMDYEYWLRIAFKGTERYHILPFVTTCYTDGGRSTNISELFRYLARIRNMMPEYGCRVSVLDNLLFYSRILGFYLFYLLKKKTDNIKP